MIDLENKRWFVRIRAGSQRALATSVYYRNELRNEMMIKWMWYFKYREAIYRVNNPKHYCELEWGSYDYIPPKQELLKRLRDKIINKKGRITEKETKLRMAREKWNELFPIEQYELYWKAVAKIESMKKELLELEQEYNEANQ